MRGLRTFHVSNYKSLQDVTVELGALNVLVGPNAAGKSNLLQAMAFLGDVARTDLLPALELHGGIEALFFRGSASQVREMTIAVKAAITEHAAARRSTSTRSRCKQANAWSVGSSSSRSSAAAVAGARREGGDRALRPSPQ